MDNTMYNNMEETEVKHDYGMKWHYFLIWFLLFFSAIINIVDGISCMEYAGQVGGAAFFGISEIALGIFLIFVRFQLSGFKVNAVNYFTAAQVFVIIMSVLSAAVLGMEMNVSDIASNIGMIVITRAYYAKRAELFVN